MKLQPCHGGQAWLQFLQGKQEQKLGRIAKGEPSTHKEGITQFHTRNPSSLGYPRPQAQPGRAPHTAQPLVNLARAYAELLGAGKDQD
jgi:hypothetical protein